MLLLLSFKSPRFLRSTLFPYTTLFRSHAGLRLRSRSSRLRARRRAGRACRDGQARPARRRARSRERPEQHTTEIQSLRHLVCRLLLEKIKRETEVTDP